MIVIPGRIPITIHPFFWLFAALIGWLSSGTLVGVFVWVGIIFFSVLIHEYGHALAALFFKQNARIQLVALGGLTIFDGPKLKFWQQFIITLNGPLFGFLLFLLATFLLQFSFPPFLMQVLKLTQFANLFWTVVNLIPVLPLDGGQLLRITLEGFFGVQGFKASLLIGTLIALLISLGFFLVQNFFIGAFFFLFAYQSFSAWRESRFATRNDRDEANKQLMIQAEEALEEGRIEEAKNFLEQIRTNASGGVLAFAAQQYLAFFKFKEGKRTECYELLLPIKEHLADEALCILHELAAEQKNYPLVIELSAKCYQIQPSQKMALNNARAFAYQHQAKPAGGWLQTAWQYGGIHMEAILAEEEFKGLKTDPEFKEFIEGLK